MFSPTALGCLLRDFPALFGRHSLKPSLPAYPSALAPHSSHNAGYVGRGNLGFGPSGSADHLKRGLVHVHRILAYTLWHTLSIAQASGHRQACEIQSSPLPTADHALSSVVVGGSAHYSQARSLPGARAAEAAFLRLAIKSDIGRRRVLIPMIRAEMKRRAKIRVQTEWKEELVAMTT